MKRKTFIACGLSGALAVAFAVFLLSSGSENPLKEAAAPPAMATAAHMEKTPEKTSVQIKEAAPPDLREVTEDAPALPSSVDSIKQQIYSVNIEYTDDLDYLDDMVQPSAADPPALWNGSWVSEDDWKRYDDTFKIERDDSGNYRFIPEKDGTQSYTYDKEKKEFKWELNYYGKIITNKARFITDDVMVLMKISGEKVALDIYRRDLPQTESP